jgi:spermidine synthase
MLAVLALLFVLSGAAGLFYEAVWSRYLSLFVGHDAYAQILTLVIFLGGMGVGALLVSRHTAKLKDPLMVYAVVEAVIGVLGLAFHDSIYLPVTQWAYQSLFPGLGGGTGVLLAKWLLAGLLILPQSILLGATFPLMSAGALRRFPNSPGRTLAMLYFSNSLGAAGGVLIAGFVLFDLAGLPGTLAAAAVLNLVVALGAIVVARSARLSADSDQKEAISSQPSAISLEAPRAESGVPGLPGLLLLLAAGTAVASFIYEIGWLRMLSMVIGSSTHSFELMLSAFILGLALGALWIRQRADRLVNPLKTLAIVQLAMGALALASIPLYLESFKWTAALLQATARSEDGYVLFTVARYLICLGIMLPATFCAGMTLPLMTRMLMAGGAGESGIGAIYGANTLGSIVGAAAAGLVLLPALGLKGALVTGGVLDMLLGVLALRYMTRSGSPAPRLLWAGTGALAVLAGGAIVAVPWDQNLLSSGVFRVGRVPDRLQKEILYHADGRTATVHATRLRSNGTKILSTNGKPDGSLSVTWYERCDTAAPLHVFSGDDGTQAGLALLLLAHAPRAQTGAVIGLGTGMSSHFLLGSPALRTLSTIEIEPAMVSGARVFLPGNRRVFDDPRSRIVIDDAKSFFASANTKYDLVLSEPSNPWVSGVSGLFTTEFYARVKRYLSPGAVFGQWLHTYELTDGLVLSVLAALHENFADYRVYLINAGDLLVVATAQGRLPAPDWSVAELPALRQDLCRFLPMTEAALERTLVLDRAGIAPALDRGVRANSDFYPVLDLGAERSRFLQQLAIGLANLGSGVLGYVVDPALRPAGFDSATSSVLSPSPAVRGMTLAAQMRRPGQDSAWTEASGSSERYLHSVWLRQIASGAPPLNWRAWTQDFWTIRRALSGGSAPADTQFFSRAKGFLDRAAAPDQVGAAVALGEALSRGELDGAVFAVEVMLREVRLGRLWVPADDLLDGAVRVLLAAGQADRARAAYDAIRPYSTRSAGDLRLILLNSYIEGARSTAP